jgi:hypothetical protein
MYIVYFILYFIRYTYIFAYLILTFVIIGILWLREMYILTDVENIKLSLFIGWKLRSRNDITNL